MQSFFKFPEPGPETEAQKERREYLGLMIAQRKVARRKTWVRRYRRIAGLFRK